MKTARAKVLFIEVDNDNKEFLLEQYRSMAKNCPDYVGVDALEAVSG